MGRMTPRAGLEAKHKPLRRPRVKELSRRADKYKEIDPKDRP